MCPLDYKALALLLVTRQRGVTLISSAGLLCLAHPFPQLHGSIQAMHAVNFRASPSRPVRCCGRNAREIPPRGHELLRVTPAVPSHDEHLIPAETSASDREIKKADLVRLPEKGA